MKIKLADAARELNYSILEFLQRIYTIDKSLEMDQIWPEIDSSFVETIRKIDYKNLGNKIHTKNRELKSAKEIERKDFALSNDAKKIIEKLKRQGKWGGAHITVDGLINITHIGKKDIQEAIKELEELDLIDKEKFKNGLISLNPKKRKEIENIIKESWN